tara:strand:+ start:860 stop:1024 length:165 start_codon:yes stop_codon:yes gene_type:complete
VKDLKKSVNPFLALIYPRKLNSWGSYLRKKHKIYAKDCKLSIYEILNLFPRDNF